MQKVIEGRMEGKQPRGRKKMEELLDDIRRGGTYFRLKRIENFGGERIKGPALEQNTQVM